MDDSVTRTAWRVSSMGQLAIMLEASAPKPGNVNRGHAFSDTEYRHFLASAALVGRSYYEAAVRGVLLARGGLSPGAVRLGRLILECAQDVARGARGRNTVMGTTLLHIPLIVAAASSLEQTGRFVPQVVEQGLHDIIDATTVEDTLDLYRAFHVVRPRGDSVNRSERWTPVHDRYDINNPQVFDNVRADGLTLIGLFRISAPVDSIAREWACYFSTVLHRVVPYLASRTSGLDDIEEAIVRTFVWLLACRPDGLIVKKAGEAAAKRVMELARTIHEAQKKDGAEVAGLLAALDQELRRDGNTLNPGTTADLISAATLCVLVTMESDLESDQDRWTT